MMATDELDLDLLADLVRRTVGVVPPRGAMDYADYVGDDG